MTLFLSHFINQMDAKGRVSVPASFREQKNILETEKIVLYRSFKHACVEGCDTARMVQLSDAADDIPSFSETQDSLTALIFADAVSLHIDGTGRIILPEDFIKHANLESKVAFVGRGKTFQIWNPELFEENQKHLRAAALQKTPELLMRKK